MSYQTLYRKWRPSAFAEVKGQDAVVTTLQNQVKNGRIGHAYLFCGTRGTGKTTVARIFARAVNCTGKEEGSGEPCNGCASCRTILAGSSMDVTEIDAASNNGVDNIRDIRDQVEYPPTEGRYRIYIIDEVHMLTTGAFNALLKTLEEPPEYVIFILATTDPQKVPQTILSRCQRFDFRRMEASTICGYMKQMCAEDGIAIEERALSYIARAAEGSMRDGLSILDQCLAYRAEGPLTYEDVLGILGTAGPRAFSSMLRHMLKGEAESVLEALDEMLTAGGDENQILKDFVWHLRNVLLAGCGSSAANILEVSREELSLLSEDFALAGRDRILVLITSLGELLNRIRFASQRRVLAEVELLRLCVSGCKNERVMGVSAPSESESSLKTVKPVASDRPAGAGMPSSAGTVPYSASDRPAGAGNPSSAGTVQPSPSDRREKSVIEVQGPESPKNEVQVSKIPVNDIQAPAAPEYTSSGGDTGDSTDLEFVKSRREELLAGLDGTNRAVFRDAVPIMEQQKIRFVFLNPMNYRIASTNRNENGLKKLEQLCREKYGRTIGFSARMAKPGEFGEDRTKVTAEDLKKINFPVIIEDD